MELYPREIDVKPGKPPQARNPGNRNVRNFDGSGVIVVRNNTTQQNAFRVSVRCEDNPYWQASWYSLSPLPPQGNAGALRADDSGPGWVKVFVPAGGHREINLLFEMLERPDSRAGTYSVVVDVEASVGSGEQVGTEGGARGEIRGTVYVHPYYLWRANLDPQLATPERHVKRSRPKAEAELVIENQGNDYLYLDAAPVKSLAFAAEPATVRIAIPPPDRREPQMIRRVPIALTAAQRPLKGAVTKNPVQVQVTRVEAPSIAPPPGAVAGVTGLPQGAVLVTPATLGVVSQTPTETLVYHPPLPNTVTDFFRSVSANAKGLVMAGFALVIAGLLIVKFVNGRAAYSFSAKQLAVSANDDYKVVVTVKEPLPFFLRGPFAGYTFSAIPSKNNDGVFDPKDEVFLTNENVKAGNARASKAPKTAGPALNASAALGTVNESLDAATVNLGQEPFKGHKIRIYAKRGGLCAWVNWFGDKPIACEGSDGIAVGNIPPPPEKPKPLKLAAGSIGPDGKIRIAASQGKFPPDGAGVEILAGADSLAPSAVKVVDGGKAVILNLPPAYVVSGGDVTVTAPSNDPQQLTIKPAPTPTPIPVPSGAVPPPVPNATGGGAAAGGSSGPGNAGGGTNVPQVTPPTTPPSVKPPVVNPVKKDFPSAHEQKIDFINQQLANPARTKGDEAIVDATEKLPGGTKSVFSQMVKALVLMEQAKAAKVAGDTVRQQDTMTQALDLLDVKKLKKADKIDQAFYAAVMYNIVALSDTDHLSARPQAQTMVDKVKNEVPYLEILLQDADKP